MNDNFPYNIISLEDPVEFTHKRKKASISQREVGRDVESFSEGLKHVFRQDPDVIVIGEMRNVDTFRAAIEGAASGHLVLSTIHSSDTLDAVDRIVNAFDFQEQPYVRQQLTNVIKVIISQRLVPEKNNKGCVPATEILFGTLQLKKLLSGGNSAEAKFLIEKGGAYGMHTFDQDLLRMVEAGLISGQEALNNSSNPNDLRIKLQGQGDSSLEAK
jgi:twitching motility protein PilT